MFTGTGLINHISHLPRAISAWKNVYINLKNKDNRFWKIIHAQGIL